MFSKKNTRAPRTIPVLAEVKKELKKTAFAISIIKAVKSHRNIKRKEENKRAVSVRMYVIIKRRTVSTIHS